VGMGASVRRRSCGRLAHRVDRRRDLRGVRSVAFMLFLVMTGVGLVVCVGAWGSKRRLEPPWGDRLMIVGLAMAVMGFLGAGAIGAVRL
jgi:hypothetical protein